MSLNKDLKSTLGIITNVPKIDWYNYKGIIIAPPKFGKTTLASLIPNSILLAFESGFDSVKIDVKEIKSWEEFVDFIDLLEENISSIGEDLRILVFDTVHRAWDLCSEYMLNKCNREKGKKYSRIQNVPYAEGLDRRDDEFRGQLSRLDTLGIKTIMFGHTVEKKVNKEGEEPYTYVDHDFEKRLADIIVKDTSYILIGENFSFREEDEDGNVTYVPKRKFIAKNDGLNRAGGRVYIGKNIEFDTETDFLDKFQQLFKEMVTSKNNINEKDAEKMIKAEVKEVIEKRGEEEIKKNLISEITSTMRASSVADKNKIKKFLKSKYDDNTIAVLSSRTIEELKEIKKELEK